MDAQFTVNRFEWRDTLKRLHKMAQGLRRTGENLVFEFDGPSLKLTYATVSVTIPGKGAAQGRAAVSGKALNALQMDSTRIDAPGELAITVDQGRLNVGSITLHCMWSPAAGAGLDARKVDAQRQTETLITQAAKILAPLGISQQALALFVAEQTNDSHSQETH
jgi:hypothetical protein